MQKFEIRMLGQAASDVGSGRKGPDFTLWGFGEKLDALEAKAACAFDLQWECRLWGSCKRVFI